MPTSVWRIDMCIFSAPKDNSAQIAREQEDQRRARITEGTASIDSAFAGFDDSFFSGIEQSANDFFNPQIDRQFDRTRETLIKNLARQGNLNASTGARQLADLDTAGQEQRVTFADKARGFATDSRADVENNRANLLRQLQASADPSAAAATAAGQAQVLSAPPTFSPIGDLFTQFGRNAEVQIENARRGFNNPASLIFKPDPSFSITNG